VYIECESGGAPSSPRISAPRGRRRRNPNRCARATPMIAGERRCRGESPATALLGRPSPFSRSDPASRLLHGRRTFRTARGRHQVAVAAVAESASRHRAFLGRRTCTVSLTPPPAPQKAMLCRLRMKAAAMAARAGFKMRLGMTRLLFMSFSGHDRSSLLVTGFSTSVNFQLCKLVYIWCNHDYR